MICGIPGLVGACGTGGGSAACGPVVREQLDPQSFIHLVDPVDVDYVTDPPTSGPHVAGVQVTGTSDTPLPPAMQVSLLEQGMVLLQHRDLVPDEMAELESLAGPDVVVAPNPDLAASVVATAWLTKQTCDAVDAETLATFVADHVAPDRAPHGDAASPDG